MVVIHPPGLDRLLGLRPVLAGAGAALFTVVVLGTALVVVALFVPLLERCPWEKGQRFVKPGTHRGGPPQSCSMTAGWAPRGDVLRAHGVRA